MAIATNDSTLRSAIQNASSVDSFVGLTGTSQLYSVLTLGKRSCIKPAAVAYDGYTVQGSTATLANSQELRNTRIYQQNVDSAYAPGLVKDLTLNYFTGGAADNGALLSMTSTGSRSLTLDNLLLKGVHKGWTGNGNLYMSLRSFNASKPLATTFTLSGSSIDITGQNNGFQSNFGVVSGGSAFIHNWNNNAVFTLTNNIFDEAGYLSSFNLLNYSTVYGSALISNNTFKRTAHADVRWEGNRLQNVVATLTNNTFQNGSYVDLYGSIGSITLTSNTFNTIAGGYGIRVTDPVTGTPTLSGTNTFSGGGLALKYVKASAGSYSITAAVTINGTSFDRMSAGGQADDTITMSSGNNWISGDLGDRKSTRLNSSHSSVSRMPSSA